MESSEKKSDVKGLVVSVLVGVITAVLIRTFLLGSYYVPTGSMIPTIKEGDYVLGELVSYHLRDPEPSEIITFTSPVDDKILIKRVIASAGQTIDIRDGEVWVDNVKLDEPYVHGQKTTAFTQQAPGVESIVYPYTIPDNMIWVMGDNRSNSGDSRYFGPVSRSAVLGRALGVFWPFDHMALW